MKRLIFFIAISAVFLTACGHKKDVRNFAINLAEKVAENQRDSILRVYPEAEVADSFALTFNPDSVTVKTSDDDGCYIVSLSPEASLMVYRAPDGSMSVVQSKGIFAYPDEKLIVAKKTGMWSDKLSDVEMNARMNDEEFFKYIADHSANHIPEILTLGKPDKEQGIGRYYPVINNTDSDVDSTEYYIKVRDEHPDYKKLGYTGGASFYVIPGKTVPAKGTAKIPIDSTAGVTAKSIIMRIPLEQLAMRFIDYTGNEYREYLNSKK